MARKRKPVPPRKTRPAAFAIGGRVTVIDFDFERGTVSLPATVTGLMDDGNLLIVTDLCRELQIHRSLARPVLREATR